MRPHARPREEAPQADLSPPVVGDPVDGAAAGCRIKPLGRRLGANMRVRVALRRKAAERRGRTTCVDSHAVSADAVACVGQPNGLDEQGPHARTHSRRTGSVH